MLDIASIKVTKSTHLIGIANNTTRSLPAGSASARSTGLPADTANVPIEERSGPMRARFVVDSLIIGLPLILKLNRYGLRKAYRKVKYPGMGGVVLNSQGVLQRGESNIYLSKIQAHRETFSSTEIAADNLEVPGE